MATKNTKKTTTRTTTKRVKANAPRIAKGNTVKVQLTLPKPIHRNLIAYAKSHNATMGDIVVNGLGKLGI